MTSKLERSALAVQLAPLCCRQLNQAIGSLRPKSNIMVEEFKMKRGKKAATAAAAEPGESCRHRDRAPLVSLRKAGGLLAGARPPTGAGVLQ